MVRRCPLRGRQIAEHVLRLLVGSTQVGAPFVTEWHYRGISGIAVSISHVDFLGGLLVGACENRLIPAGCSLCRSGRVANPVPELPTKTHLNGGRYARRYISAYEVLYCVGVIDQLEAIFG